MQRFSLSIVNIFVFFVLFTWWKKVSETWDRADRQVHWTASGCCCSWLLRDITPAFGYQPTAVAHYHINVCKFDKVKANFASPLLLAVLSWNCNFFFFKGKRAHKNTHTHTDTIEVPPGLISLIVLKRFTQSSSSKKGAKGNFFF